MVREKKAEMVWLIRRWNTPGRCKRGKPKLTWNENIRKAMERRNLKESKVDIRSGDDMMTHIYRVYFSISLSLKKLKMYEYTERSRSRLSGRHC